MKFFVPDWDERVDPDYDFLTDRFTLVRDPYLDDKYAHEIMHESVYDGVLVSRMALGETGPKRQLVERVGMREYLRLPPKLSLLGDCGAFGYIREYWPRFETTELVNYYGRLGFDLGASIDHAIVPEFFEQRHHRYELTLRNAEEFIREHRAGKHRFTPIGSIQGWDITSYVEAARALIDMGFDYLAVGGLARRRTKWVLSILRAISDEVPDNTRLHAFGIARPSVIPELQDINVASVDSSSPIRQAWMSATDNYHTDSGNYVALRIPIVEQERAVRDTLVARSDATYSALKEAEYGALSSIREYDKGQLGLKSTLSALLDYDMLLANRREQQHARVREDRYRATLRDRPWKKCKCSICRSIGVEVIIFRGNNRNRRRGFHNLTVMMRNIAKTESIQ